MHPGVQLTELVNRVNPSLSVILKGQYHVNGGKQNFIDGSQKFLHSSFLFAICNSCLWCASVFCEYLSGRFAEEYFCPLCCSRVEMIPLADGEVYRLGHSKKGGLELEFSLKYAVTLKHLETINQVK